MRLEQETEPAKKNDPSTTDPISQQRIENAHRKLLENAFGDQMRQATELLKENHLTDALAAQRRAQQQLDKVVEELGGRNTGGLESSSQSMSDFATRLDKLADNGQRVAEQLKQAVTTPNAKRRELARQLQALQDEIEQLADQPALQANQQLHDLLDQATDAVEEAIPPAEQAQFSEASQDANRAVESLNSAAQSALQKAEQMQSQVAEQQMFDLRTLLSAAVKRQTPIVDSLAQLNNLAPLNTAGNNSSSRHRPL